MRLSDTDSKGYAQKSVCLRSKRSVVRIHSGVPSPSLHFNTLPFDDFATPPLRTIAQAQDLNDIDLQPTSAGRSEQAVKGDDCPECGGAGWIIADCFEDTCCCMDPEVEHGVIRCPSCSTAQRSAHAR